jgi:hypothetical protein
MRLNVLLITGALVTSSLAVASASSVTVTLPPAKY